MANGKSRMFHPDTWEVGDLLKCEGKIWRVGMRSDLRMRLDPISGFLTTIGETSFPTYSKSINVSPNSVLDRVSENELDAHQRRRLANLKHNEEVDTKMAQYDEQEQQESDMSEQAEATETTVAAGGKVAGTIKPPKATAAAQPVVASVSDNKKANAERLAKLKEKKQTAPGAVAKAASPVVKKEKALSPCKCGCETMVAGNFAQGHDARFKSWLLKIERGEMQVKELPAKVQKAYQWVKKGDGMIPTTNYKGEKHGGYDKE